jgi:transcriptional regulator with XRE-family HTH domain
MRTPPLADVLRGYRRVRDISQRALAFRLGWAPSRLSEIESAKVKPKRETLDEIMKAMELEPDERGYVLLAGSFQPDEQETDRIWKSESGRTGLEERLEIWPFPAYIVDFSFRFLRWNKVSETFFEFMLPQIGYIREHHPHTLEVMFDDRYRLTDPSVMEPDAWERMVRQEIVWFKAEQRGRTRETWYQKLLQRLAKYERFKELWDATPVLEDPRFLEFRGDVEFRSKFGPLHLYFFNSPVLTDPRFSSVFYTPDAPSFVRLMGAGLLDEVIRQASDRERAELASNIESVLAKINPQKVGGRQ